MKLFKEQINKRKQRVNKLLWFFTELHGRSALDLSQTQIKNSQSVRWDVVKITHSVKLLRRHLMLKTLPMLLAIKWFCT